VLSEAAGQYLAHKCDWESDRFLPPHRCRELFKNLARSCDALLNEIEIVQARTGRIKVEHPVSPSALDGTTWADVLRILSDLKVGADAWSRPFWWHTFITWSFSGRLEPRVVYLQRILMLWTMFGGKLQISRHPVSGKISGPLVRYLTAVTVPVMGRDAPKPVSFPGYIKRQREFYRTLQQIENSPRA
jgi:hypothetical protein